ncbi:MAG: hypothetical protein EOP52_08705 [Sphingobacteriales bacterium]|nr:MAG: hypothetical protein EOP52_08705 [Sphingobacteriales bacterium]
MHSLKRVGLLAGGLLVLLTSCDSWQEGWTEDYRQQFKESCLTGDGQVHLDPETYCNCALEKTMQQYPTIAAFMEQQDTAAYRQALKSCP